MQMNRRAFLGSAFATVTAAALPGYSLGAGKAKVAVQLYSIRDYIKTVGIEKALADVAKIGYAGVEFAGYWGKTAQQLKKLLDDNGLIACGTHVGRDAFSPAHVKSTCEFNLAFGNTTIICPGGGNTPPNFNWGKPANEYDAFWKTLVDYYNKAAEDAAKFGCKIGLHNHQWEFQTKLMDGTLMWDYFFKNTSPAVCMEQDVGWTTCAGFDPCEQYVKYPHRSPTLHAKENGMGSKKFDAILGQAGEGAKGVDWDKLFTATDADGVKWYIVECERHADSLMAIEGSFKFLHSKGRC